jgi:outer membrane protein TolC
MLTKVRRQIVEEVRKAYETFSQSLDTAALARNQLLPAQELRRSQTESAYRTGQTDITALILAEQDLQASRTKLIELSGRTATAFIRLQRAVGGAGVESVSSLRVSTSGPSTLPTTTHAASPPEPPIR